MKQPSNMKTKEAFDNYKKTHWSHEYTENGILNYEDFCNAEELLVRIFNQTNSELLKENEKRFIQWQNQCDTIRNWQNVFNKHFEGFACSDNLDEQLTELKADLKRETECVEHIKKVCDGYEKELQAANERITELEEAIIFNNSELVKLREIIQLKEDAYSDVGNKYSHALLRIKEHEKFFKWVIKGDRKLNDYRLKAIELIDPIKYGEDKHNL